MNKIYLTGDTHHNLDIKKIADFNFTPNSKLIVLGDWGGLWYNDYRKNYKILSKWCKWQENKNFTLLALLGNHENYRLINKLPSKIIKDENNLLKIKELKVINPFKRFSPTKCKLYILENGIQIIENKKFLAIRGAASVDKENRIEGETYWKEEILSDEEKEEIIKQIEKEKNFDFVITHTAPAFIVKTLIKKYNIEPKKLDDVSIFLEKIYKEITFKKWYFGHFHLDTAIDNFECLYNKIIEI